MNEQTYRVKDEQENRRIEGRWKDEQAERWKDEQAERWKDEQVNE